MARLTKETLKKLLRECLVEILEEENVFLVKESKEISKVPASSVEDRQLIREKLQSVQKEEPENVFMKESIANLSERLSIADKSKKALFESIFEDTAKTTYRDMLQNDINYRGAPVPLSEQQVQADEQKLKEIVNLAADGDMSRWAKVAFAGSSKK